MTSVAPAGRRSPVVVHNSDGVNPYAAELASLLTGRAVALVDAANSENAPDPAVRWLRRLPATFGAASALRQALALARGVATTAWLSLARRHTVLVAFTRFPAEDLALALLGLLGRPVVVVVHNPVPREAESRLAARARRALLRRARVAVVHAERLRPRVDPAVRGRVLVCPHPPYRVTVPDGVAPLDLPTDRTWAAFLGALRWDKGADLLADVLAAAPEEARGRLGLVVCGRGSLPEGTWERLAELGVATRDLTSDRPVTTELLTSVLRARPVVLAPYVAATQSGSVILALSTGCRVLAFDEGGIPDVVTPEGLVPTGDLEAMGRALAEGRAGAALEPVDAWAARTAQAWSAALDAARR